MGEVQVRLSHFRAREKASKQRRALHSLVRHQQLYNNWLSRKFCNFLSAFTRTTKRRTGVCCRIKSVHAACGAARPSTLLSLLHAEPLPGAPDAPISSPPASDKCTRQIAAAEKPLRTRYWPDQRNSLTVAAKIPPLKVTAAPEERQRSPVAADMRSCPVCGLRLPAEQLRAHIEAEWALMAADASTPSSQSSSLAQHEIGGVAQLSHRSLQARAPLHHSAHCAPAQAGTSTAAPSQLQQAVDRFPGGGAPMAASLHTPGSWVAARPAAANRTARHRRGGGMAAEPWPSAPGGPARHAVGQEEGGGMAAETMQRAGASGPAWHAGRDQQGGGVGAEARQGAGRPSGWGARRHGRAGVPSARRRPRPSKVRSTDGRNSGPCLECMRLRLMGAAVLAREARWGLALSARQAA